MAVTNILLLRHAEKPNCSERSIGLTPEGVEDDKSLTVRGWQRAGALAALFAANRWPNPHQREWNRLTVEVADQDNEPIRADCSNQLVPALRLPNPDRIYASAFREGGGHSRRPEQTVQPLAQKLRLPIDLTWALHQEEAFGAAVAAEAGTTLVCWQHQGLATLARAIAAPQRLPELGAGWRWPEDRYDVVWALQRDGAGEAWHFTQYCQALLSGDSDQPFILPASARNI